LNRRIKKIVGSETRLFYFNKDWQCLEDYVNAGCINRWIWGLRYVDDLISHQWGGIPRYALQDANWNVIALYNSSTNTVEERYTYNAFGKVCAYDESFAPRASLNSFLAKTFTGQVYDRETGLMLYRNRVYHPTLGRFIQRDPIGYEAGDVNLMRYIQNFPVLHTDPNGLEKCGPRVWLYTGDWCVDDNVWDAAIEAAGKVVSCWWDCEITTHTNVATYIEGALTSTSSWAIVERAPILQKTIEELSHKLGPVRKNTSILSRIAYNLKKYSRTQRIGQIIRNHMRYTRNAPIRSICRTGVIGFVITETIISFYCSWKCA
jgi:RHS repeat-associated protein